MNFKFYNFSNAIIDPFKTSPIRSDRGDLIFDDYRFSAGSVNKFRVWMNRVEVEAKHKIDIDEGCWVGLPKNFYHLMVEQLPKIMGCFDSKENLCVNKNTTIHYKKMFDMLFEWIPTKSISKYDVEYPVGHFSDYRLKFNKLKLYASDNKIIDQAFLDVKRLAVKMWSKFKQDHFETPKKFRKIFIYRNTQYRPEGAPIKERCVNQLELYDYLKSLDFEIIDPSPDNFLNTINKMREAKIIVGDHGAGLTNMLFCDDKTKFVQFCWKHGAEMHYKRLAEYKKMPYYVIYGYEENNLNELSKLGKRYIISLKDLQRQMKEVIND